MTKRERTEREVLRAAEAWVSRHAIYLERVRPIFSWPEDVRLARAVARMQKAQKAQKEAKR